LTFPFANVRKSHRVSASPLENRLLAALPRQDYERSAPELELVQLSLDIRSTSQEVPYSTPTSRALRDQGGWMGKACARPYRLNAATLKEQFALGGTRSICSC
jgi:hypothetical protein